MPGCVLRVGTRTSDVDRAVEASGLRPINVFRKGTPKVPGAGTLATVSGFNVDVSPNESLERQVRGAIQFLRRHGPGLRRLRRLKHFGAMTLDFADRYRPTAATPFPTYRFPAALIDLAGKHGIEIHLSLYGRD